MESDRQGNRLRFGSIRPIRVPLALGAVRAGVDEGAEVLDRALRARLEQRWLSDLLARLEPSQTVPVARHEHLDPTPRPGTVMFLPEVAAACVDLASRVQSAIQSGALALTLGGDHAVAIGSVAGAAAGAERLAVVWIDAHGDINWPEVSPSGHLHGMPLAVALGRGPADLTRICRRCPKVRPEDVYLLGVRNLDLAEREWLASGEIPVATMAAIDAAGLDATVRLVIDRIRASGADAVHVSFDVDALDPLLMPGTGTRAWGGFTFREASRLLRMLRDADLPVRSLDWVELNPALDPSGASTSVATELLAIALGEETI